MSDPTHEGILDERDWNESNIVEIREKGCNAANRVKYRASKSLAEKAAWAFIEEHKDEITWDLVAINPPYVCWSLYLSVRWYLFCIQLGFRAHHS